MDHPPGYFNCHATGLHSVVLTRYPDGRPWARMFYAAPNHTLWMNNPFRADRGDPMSVAIHPHRMDIDLRIIAGPVFRVGAFLAPDGPYKMTPWRYTSQLLTGSGGFERMGEPVGVHLDLAPLVRIRMRAGDLHTVCVRQGCEAAWLVVEGDLDPNYQPVAYSTSDLSTFSFGDFNQPMTDREAADIVAKAFDL